MALPPDEAAFVGDDFPDMSLLTNRRTAGGRRQRGARGARHLPAPADAPRRARRGPRVRRGFSQGARRMGDRLDADTWTRARSPRDAGAGVSHDEIVERGRRVVRLEHEALAALEQRLGREFANAVHARRRSSGGRVIVAGVGKSGLVGRKIAATLTSTGTPATFLHPVDSVHGDLGIVGSDDVAILISKSGESDELLELLAHLKGFGVRTIAITGDTALVARQELRRGPRCRGAGGGLPARSRADHQHDGGAGDRRCAGGGAAAGKGVPARGFRPDPPGRRPRAASSSLESKRSCSATTSRCWTDRRPCARRS